MNAPTTARLVVAGACALLFAATQQAAAENWPLWRGAKLDGISHETGLPLTWTKTENVVWRLPLPGPAGSTPVVWGRRIFLTAADESNLVLLCVDTDGHVLWKKVMADHNERVHGDEGNLASPSPSTDGEHVWAFMGSGDLGCYTIDGAEVWKFNVQDRYGKFEIMWSMASTPLLDGERLYLQLIHSGGARVIALDKHTGREIWAQRRSTDARAECEQSYASPIVYRDIERELLLTHGGDYIVAHRLADGEEVWRCGGMNPKGRYNQSLRFIATPVATPGLIIVPSAKNGPVLGLDPASQGDISDSTQGHRWVREHNTPDVPSPLVVDGLVYLCREDGTLLVLDVKTGEEIYQRRGHSGRHRASPVYADGRVYLTARDGTVTVVKAGREFEVLATNTLDESMASSPVISNGRIYLRTYGALYAVGKQ